MRVPRRERVPVRAYVHTNPRTNAHTWKEKCRCSLPGVCWLAGTQVRALLGVGEMGCAPSLLVWIYLPPCSLVCPPPSACSSSAPVVLLSVSLFLCLLASLSPTFSLSPCLPVSLSPCLPVSLSTRLPVSLYPRLPVSLSRWLPSSLSACLRASLSQFRAQEKKRFPQ